MAVAAHELVTSRVVVTVAGDGGYTAEFTTDAASLLARLQAASRQARPRIVGRDEYGSRIAALGSTLLAHAELRVDGAPVPLQVESVQLDGTSDPESDLRPPAVVVRLRGLTAYSRPRGSRAAKQGSPLRWSRRRGS